MKGQADKAYRDGMRAQAESELARRDYFRLRDENRERQAARGKDRCAADAIFSGYAVAKDCIDSEQMLHRWALDRFAASRAAYAKASQIMDNLVRLVQARRPRVPTQRVGA